MFRNFYGGGKSIETIYIGEKIIFILLLSRNLYTMLLRNNTISVWWIQAGSRIKKFFKQQRLGLSFVICTIGLINLKSLDSLPLCNTQGLRLFNCSNLFSSFSYFCNLHTSYHKYIVNSLFLDESWERGHARSASAHRPCSVGSSKQII